MSFFFVLLSRLFFKYEELGGDVFDLASTCAVTMWGLLLYYFVYGRKSNCDDVCFTGKSETEGVHSGWQMDEALDTEDDMELLADAICGLVLVLDITFACALMCVCCRW